jgi:hypothetical protein
MCRGTRNCGTRLCAEDAGFGEACMGGRAHRNCEQLTWLANCARRILRQLMVAAAKEWRGERSGGRAWYIDARQEMDVAMEPLHN